MDRGGVWSVVGLWPRAHRDFPNRLGERPHLRRGRETVYRVTGFAQFSGNEVCADFLSGPDFARSSEYLRRVCEERLLEPIVHNLSGLVVVMGEYGETDNADQQDGTNHSADQPGGQGDLRPG